MSDDLVSRLRDAHANATQRILGSSIFGDAATALSEARAEIERLRELCGESADIIRRQQGWQEYGEQLERDADAAMAAEIQEQRLKNATLRARVREVVGPLIGLTEDFKIYGGCVGAARQLMEEVK